MNKKQYQVFLDYVEAEDKDNALTYIIDLLEKGESVRNIYEYFLVPSLSEYRCLKTDEEICIWKEHTRTSIIRTILEASYPFLIKSKENPIRKKVITLCPKEEYHEIGAIIANNYFSLVGFDASYIGANTPSDDILSAIRVLQPDFVALSVTNYYNLVITKRLTERIRNEFPDVKIIVGGQAFTHPKSLCQIIYDYKLDSYEDILAFRKEVSV